METRHYWEENGHAVKYDNYNSNDGFNRGGAESLGFTAPASEDESEYQSGNYLKKGKVSRQQDPMSHRIIEKRRRDRMNNCLADLSRLIPPEYLKKGRGRVEKTEIIEMAIRHLKFLQERANGLNHVGKPDYVAERQLGDFHAGYQEAATEAVRYLCEVHGYAPADGLCVQLTAHLQRHCELITKSDKPIEKIRTQPSGSSSETASSSGSSRGYEVKGVIATAPPPAQPTYPPNYETEPEPSYSMDCDRVSAPPTVSVRGEPGGAGAGAGLEPVDGRRRREPALRALRKPDHDDYLHSYKFKNSIERRFSRSQDSEVSQDMAADALARVAHAQVSLAHAQLQAHAHGHTHAHAHSRGYTHAHLHLHSHKRRRAAKPPPPPPGYTSTSGSGSTEDARDTSPQDTSSESPHHHHYEKPAPAQFVPVFALNALGKYYVPLSVDYACLARYLGPYDVLDARAVQMAAPLHPVTIHVNFQPCLNYHVKREPNDREWRPV